MWKAISVLIGLLLLAGGVAIVAEELHPDYSGTGLRDALAPPSAQATTQAPRELTSTTAQVPAAATARSATASEAVPTRIPIRPTPLHSTSTPVPRAATATAVPRVATVPAREATLRSIQSGEMVPAFTTQKVLQDHIQYDRLHQKSDRRQFAHLVMQLERQGKLVYLPHGTTVKVTREIQWTHGRGLEDRWYTTPIAHIQITSGDWRGHEFWVEGIHVFN